MVHIVTPGVMLSKRDETDFFDYFMIANLTSRVCYHSNLDFAKSSDDIVILDEGDYFIFEDPSKF